ncbi:VOC family protein [Rhodococcus rhodnii]|uniref:Cell wall protein n=2 Tax=Rhodococcus rhodnii TaxID=38312 RepID=R7WTJ4_9NOCA|nr:VOC family protein [Rhodococcus rhodnii]EOM78595.1 cell wall protein [Rhodococcus rhodnii LMG 5362]TXG91376.1 VOC family protein [Rhodococcus rhodnii]
MTTITEAFSGFAVPDLDAADAFYRDVLGLAVERDAMGISTLTLPDGTPILVYPKPDHRPAVYTILNFVVPDIDAAVADLTSRGIELLRYDGFDHDEKGIVRSTGDGPTICWFTDPAENVLSFIQN